MVQKCIIIGKQTDGTLHSSFAYSAEQTKTITCIKKTNGHWSNYKRTESPALHFKYIYITSFWGGNHFSWNQNTSKFQVPE